MPDGIQFGIRRFAVIGMPAFRLRTFGAEAIGVEAGHLPRFPSEGGVASVAEFCGEEVIGHFSNPFIGERYEGEFGFGYIARIDPFDDLFKAGDVLVKFSEAVGVAAEDDGVSGDDQLLVAEEGECAGDRLEFSFLVATQDYASVQFDELDEVASDQVVETLQGFVWIRHIDFRDGAVGRVYFDS